MAKFKVAHYSGKQLFYGGKVLKYVSPSAPLVTTLDVDESSLHSASQSGFYLIVGNEDETEMVFPAWQTFTAGLSGPLSKIVFPGITSKDGSTITIDIVENGTEGNDYQDGDLLASENITVTPNTVEEKTVEFSSPAVVSSNSVYVIRMISADQGNALWFYYPPDDYPGGKGIPLSHNDVVDTAGGAYPGDICFQTYVDI